MNDLDSRDAHWVNSLVQNREPESAVLDFKRDLPGTDERARKEFLKDVAALANTLGGRIVYGVEEDAGHAALFRPLQGDPDNEINRLADMVAGGLEPRPSGCRYFSTPVQDGFVLVLDMPSQLDGPFQAQYSKQRWFPCRHGRVTSEMTYSQLRSAFGEKARLVGDLRAWREQRLELLLKHIPTQRMPDTAWAILHIMPIAAFAGQTSIDLHALEQRGYGRDRQAGYSRFNLDGLSFDEQRPSERRTAYAQFFRRGMVEAAWDCRVGDEKHHQNLIQSMRTADNIRSHLAVASMELASNDIAGSVAVGFSLLNAENHRLLFPTGDGFSQSSDYQYDRRVDFPELFVDRLDDIIADVDLVARPILDILWQTFGQTRCNLFDSNGSWRITPSGQFR